MRNDSQNNPQIDAKIIKWRLGAAEWAPETHCDCFRAQFGRNHFFNEFLKQQKSSKNRKIRKLTRRGRVNQAKRRPRRDKNPERRSTLLEALQAWLKKSRICRKRLQN